MAVLIIETLSLSAFVSYTLFPSGVTATPYGVIPTGTVAVTVFVVASITDVVLLLTTAKPILALTSSLTSIHHTGRSSLQKVKNLD